MAAPARHSRTRSTFAVGVLGLFALVPATEHRGIYYPRGGMIRIPEALQRCGERHGMVLRTSTRVDQVLDSSLAYLGAAQDRQVISLVHESVG